ncbi:DgyrCDS11784 [Dimorphilus gyrociliatus]|uniref:Alkaline ceramidase n=1 Tax=Dimorphilus gyrociliatus TaxID=2664684 RepID=A0A7I8W4L6_9ANNE|nr:DgyrCDS11784 [Dimorphilus gyrociliatus]
MAPTRWGNRAELRKIEPDFEGLWGDITSTMNWCEAKYEVSPYFAEFWNTISNLAMIIPPLFGIFLAWRDNMELRYILSLLSLATVGIGSWFFHMTLIYETQIYLKFPEPELFQTAYGLLVLTMVILGFRSMQKFKACKRDRMTYYLSLFSYAFGFFLWQIDVRACSHLKSIRSGIGYPIKPVLQFHAWWHIFAGTGTYISILYV